MSAERFDAVVVGAGFGGGITSLRLAEAGLRVLVLERGRRWDGPRPFPRDVRQVDDLLWRPNDDPPRTGLYDVRFFDALGAVVASGVGGGSLIYAGIHIRPDTSVFEGRGWPTTISREMLDPYYDRVAEELSLAPLPATTTVLKRDAFHRVAEAVGHEVIDPPMAMRWSNGEADSGCRLVAECEFGCQHQAKNTIDRTYIARALELGAALRTLALVEAISAVPCGYRCSYRDVKTGRRCEVEGRLVVLAAGTLGTNELLLRARDQHQTLRNLSNRLGYGYSANGDFLGMVESSEDLRSSTGPDVTSIIRYFDSEPGFTVAAPTFQPTAMSVMTGLGAVHPPIPGPLLWWLLRRYHPTLLRFGLLSRPRRLPFVHHPDAERTTFLFAIGQDNGNGRLQMVGDRLNVEWAYSQENADLLRRVEPALDDIARAYGGTFRALPTWQATKKPFTVHSLGGCHMADDAGMGVVSSEGEVFGYEGLFIADGSVIPSSIGFHPVMTICAVAERIAERAVAYGKAL